jgi:hypothetical protein
MIAFFEALFWLYLRQYRKLWDAVIAVEALVRPPDAGAKVIVPAVAAIDSMRLIGSQTFRPNLRNPSNPNGLKCDSSPIEKSIL